MILFAVNISMAEISSLQHYNPLGAKLLFAERKYRRI
jgi:hypothetical protein